MTLSKLTRRRLLQRLFSGWIGVAGLLAGCQGLHRRQDNSSSEDGAVCLKSGSAIPRRIYVATTAPHQMIVGGIEHQFVLEVIAALNSLPNCNAILLPPHFSLESLTGPEGMRPGMSEIPDVYSPDSALEELLLIDVVEMIPYRPMRLRAVLERRLLADGMVISREHRTWNAPEDQEPMFPNPFNRFILNHPQPLAQVEAQELARLSPQTFMRDVARQVATELTTASY